MTITRRVQAVFQRLAEGELSASAPAEQSGWEMSLPSGRTVVRSALQAEARPLTALGPDAVPDLLAWVTSDHLALRYVAIYALEQITGEKPFIPYFAIEDTAGHLTSATAVWRKWYEAQASSKRQESDEPTGRPLV